MADRIEDAVWVDKPTAAAAQPAHRGLTRRFRAGWPFDLLDLIAVLGLVLLGASLALVWLPLAGVVVGVLLIVYALVAALPARS
jgi:hypothetical protein